MFPNDEALDYKGLDIQAGDIAPMSYVNLDRIDDESEGGKYANPYSITANWTRCRW